MKIEKFNQLMRIENELGKSAKFAGINAFKNKKKYNLEGFIVKNSFK
jgi:hypothetical protein